MHKNKEHHEHAKHHVTGLKALAKYYDHYTIIYILRSLYSEVFDAAACKENKTQLKERIQRFEKSSHIHGYLSSLPIEKFLNELENSQYYYPIFNHEISLPKFQ